MDTSERGFEVTYMHTNMTIEEGTHVHTFRGSNGTWYINIGSELTLRLTDGAMAHFLDIVEGAVERRLEWVKQANEVVAYKCTVCGNVATSFGHIPNKCLDASCDHKALCQEHYYW